jgi:hypothetical protein
VDVTGAQIEGAQALQEVILTGYRPRRRAVLGAVGGSTGARVALLEEAAQALGHVLGGVA